MKKTFLILSLLLFASCKTGNTGEHILTYSNYEEAHTEYERILNLAIQQKTPTICKKLPVQATYGDHVDSSIFLVQTAISTYQQLPCISDYAKYYKDASACNDLYCYSGLAIHYKDTSLCQATEPNIEEACLTKYLEWQQSSIEFQEVSNEIRKALKNMPAS